MSNFRSINVSHDTFAAIWRAQLPGESSEEEILRRRFGVPAAKTVTAGNGSGFSEPRFGFSVPAGFRLHRTFRGTRYEAYAENNAWVRADTKQSCGSLQELSDSIGTKTENPWFHWHYKRADGSDGRVGDLRDQATIVRRQRRRGAPAMGLRD